MHVSFAARVRRLVGVALVVCLGHLATAAGSHAADQELEELLDVFRETVERLRSDSVDVMDDRKLIDAAIRGMLWSVDPYAEYYNSEQWRTLPVHVHFVYGDPGKTGCGIHCKEGCFCRGCAARRHAG